MIDRGAKLGAKCNLFPGIKQSAILSSIALPQEAACKECSKVILIEQLDRILPNAQAKIFSEVLPLARAKCCALLCTNDAKCSDFNDRSESLLLVRGCHNRIYRRLVLLEKKNLSVHIFILPFYIYTL